LTTLPNKDFISEYLNSTIESVKRDLDAQTDKCIDNLLKSNNLQPMVLKHDDQIRKLQLYVNSQQSSDDQEPSIVGTKMTFCLTCGHGTDRDSKIKNKYSPRKTDQYKNTRPNSAFKSTQFTEASALKDEDVSNCLSFMSSKTRSLIKNDRHSSTVKNLEIPGNRLNDSGITLD